MDGTWPLLDQGIESNGHCAAGLLAVSSSSERNTLAIAMCSLSPGSLSLNTLMGVGHLATKLHRAKLPDPRQAK